MFDKRFAIYLVVLILCQLLILKLWFALGNSTTSGDKNSLRCTNTHQHIKTVQPVDYLIPNIVHYVWFAGNRSKPFGFQNFVSVLSAYKFLQPDVIYFHCNKEPGGEHWESAKSIPVVQVLHREPPRTLFGERTKMPAFETSDSNIARVQVVLERGGIYLDTDVIVVQPFNPLRRHRCVLGLEDNIKVCAGVIMAEPNATFLYLWLNAYLDDYRVGTWAYNSGIVPSKLFKRYPDLIHIEPKRMHRPNWKGTEVKKIWGKETFDWINNYTVHLWFRKSGLKKDNLPNMTNIKTWHGGFGELARYVLFNELPERYIH